MVKTLIKLYTTTLASADSAASAICPVGGQVTSVNWAWNATTSGTVGGRGLFQLSLQSTGQFAVNDARNIIDEFSASSDCVTTGVACGANKQALISGVKINAGDKIYLHSLATTAFGASLLNVSIQIV